VFRWRMVNQDCNMNLTAAYQHRTHPDPFHHEADVADPNKVCALIDGIDGLDVTGDLKQTHTHAHTEHTR